MSGRAESFDVSYEGLGRSETIKNGIETREVCEQANEMV
jgi:hypothetical protein